MKSPLLAGIFLLAAGQLTHAQLSFLPQAGFEQSRTTLEYNALSATDISENLRASLKVDYRFKGGHGPFINLGTSPALQSFVFNNEGDLMEGRQPAKNNLRFRVETGYQYTSKAIPFKKAKAVSNAKTSVTSSAGTQQKRSCGSSAYKAHCGGNKSMAKPAPVNKSLNMRLQPSLAFAYIPLGGDNPKQLADGFEYSAANLKTAVVPAMGLQFGRGNQPLFTLTLFYTKPLGTTKETITSYSGSKPVITQMNARASTWGLTAGIPFSLAKAKSTAVKVKEVKPEVKPTQYKRCTRTYSGWQ